ncbi:phospholipase A2 inhibitor NAI-like [Podarcis raffonei]|uniref:phospholipase A2 inhibitor NAI-like n=1 Tax=Podarcis raffonei TaxID=65483 RepID=UPI002329198D|nr:phospholipase A2 inhibitor NAI-like [Podarcis raffonei]
MKQTPLFISLLAAFIALGMALECEQCTGPTSHCSGPMMQCTQEQDTCVSRVLSLSISGLDQNVFEKGCGSSKLCGKGPQIINSGPFGTTVIETHCCVGAACKTTWPPTPRRNTTLNGRQCSTCPPDGTECKFPPIKCAGEETKCFEISGATTIAGQTASTVLKGCANELACQAMETGTKTFGNVIQEVKSAKCTDGAASTIPGSLGLLFPALSGLLLVKFLA